MRRNFVGPDPKAVDGVCPSPIDLPAPAQDIQVARGLPALLAEAGAFDSSNPEWPSGEGLPGLIREYLRNN